MASDRFGRELLRELSGWLQEGLISEETAAVLSRRYEPRRTTARTAGLHLQIFLGILCTALIGSGLILLISHNWDQFPPAARLAFAYGPLAVSISLGFFVLSRRENDPRWCEPAALLLMAATASAIAIVSQVYQVLGSPADFLLVWLTLMILPLYCFRSTALSILFAAGFAALVPNCAGEGLAPWQPMLPALAVLPYLWRASGGERASGVRQISQLVIATLLFFLNIAVTTYHHALNLYWLWPVLFTVLLLAGRHLAAARGGAMNALSIVGALGFLVMLMTATFEDFWRHISRGGAGNSFSWIYLGLLTLVWLMLLLRFRRSGGVLYAAMLPPVYGICAWLGLHREPVCAMLIANLYTAVLGTGMMISGYRGCSGWRMNGGLAVLAILLFLRFCNVGDILLYAAIFLILGIAVGIANLIFARHLKKREDAR